MQPGENVRKTEVWIIIPKILSSISKVEVEESSLPASFLGDLHAGVCKCMVRTIKENADTLELCMSSSDSSLRHRKEEMRCY